MLKSVAVTASALFALWTAATALAATPWENAHPRRDQVNDRLATQDQRIHQQLREGDITRAKAVRLHRQDLRVRTEERLMARQNAGHITHGEQVALNRQENRISNRIGQ